MEKKQVDKKTKKWHIIAGAAAGICNGFFGGGGGMVLIPVMTRFGKVSEQHAFATSIAIILPLCVLSTAIYFFRGQLDLVLALPYLAGGLVGGFIGGKYFRKIPVIWLRRIFALFIIFGGVRALFC